MGFIENIDLGKMDELGRTDSPIHRLDARAKIIATIAFLVVVMSFGRYEVSALMPLFIYPFALVAAGNIPAGYIAKKVAIAAPFAVCVGIFNPILDRSAMGVLGAYPVAAGWFSFASILVRFSLTVSAALILLCCTGIHRLCEGLERLGTPRVFVVQLLFLYRYFFVIAGEAGRMIRSVEIRSAGKIRIGLRTYATLVGHLLLRSMDRAQRIYRAMVSRGFQGEVRVLRLGDPGWRELAYLGGWFFYFIVARYWNLAEEVGRHL